MAYSSNFMELWISKASPFLDVIVAVILSLLFIIIKLINQDTCIKSIQEVKIRSNEECLIWEFTMITSQHVVTRL